MKSLYEYYDQYRNLYSQPLNEKLYGNKPNAKKRETPIEHPNYPDEIEEMIDELELEIESYFDDHDEVMTSALNDYVIEALKTQLESENFDEWDKNYIHEIVRETLDTIKENKTEVIDNAIGLLFSNESRILDNIKEDLEDAKLKKTDFDKNATDTRSQKITETDFDPKEDEHEDEFTDEGVEHTQNVENLESQLQKTHYIREYKQLFDKHFKSLSTKIKKISK